MALAYGALQSFDFSSEVEVIKDYRSLRRGDHLAVKRNQFNVEYYHHGIFLGRDKVAEVGGANKQQASPRIVSIKDFTEQGDLLRIIYSPGQCFPLEEAATNAEELVANPTKWQSYGLVNNNCEHFATKCKTGTASSMQVRSKIRDAISIIISPSLFFAHTVYDKIFKS
ncbi:lecithin retinol acyltransferase-like [Dreissena polymorpha]|uniref:LRAT domain-containing protein n=1 Tax=Dreissena polymorpha TaxID=45954 RepID=A0A9D3Y8V9_DREPO|nr:lecithin retinol acyltransferase-like [Dreissena polymorpha]KAH3694124.1 hypothetical protein DPMN_081563 [Dreissena polymorpha]